MSNKYDKMLGMFVGGFIGDALGAPFELRGSPGLDQYTGVLDRKITIQTRWQGIKEYPIGSFTDDSQMELFLIKSIVRNGGNYNRDDVIKSYMEFTSQCSMLGKNTRNLLKGIKTLKGYNNRTMKFLNPSIQSNGSLMRASPLSIYSDYNIYIQDSSITNNNNTNYVCNIIYLCGLRYAIEGKSKDEIKQLFIHLSNQYQIDTINVAINQAIVGIRRNVDESFKNDDGYLGRKTNKGWVVHGIYASLWSLLQFNDYKSAIDAVVMLGGDTDTLAKIAGNLLGAYYGYTNLLSDNITKCNAETVFVTNNLYLTTFDEDVKKLVSYYK